MKILKDMSLIAMGVGATIAYQKYSKQMIECAENAMQKMMKCTCNKLDNMD